MFICSAVSILLWLPPDLINFIFGETNILNLMWFSKILNFVDRSCCCCCSVTKWHPTLCDPMDCMQHARLPCPPLSAGVCSNSLSRWCSLTSPSSAAPFSFYLQSFPVSESFPMTQLFTSDGQSTGASASVLPMNIQGRIPLGLTGLIYLLYRGLSRVFSSTIQNHQFFSAQPSLRSNSHICTGLLEKP